MLLDMTWVSVLCSLLSPFGFVIFFGLKLGFWVRTLSQLYHDYIPVNCMFYEPIARLFPICSISFSAVHSVLVGRLTGPFFFFFFSVFLFI